MDRGSGHGPRRGEVYLRLRRPHAPRIVSVRRGDADFVAREGAEVAPEARAAGRRGERRPGVHEDLDQAFLERLAIDDLRGRWDLTHNARCDLLALHQFPRNPPVLCPGWRARA